MRGKKELQERYPLVTCGTPVVKACKNSTGEKSCHFLQRYACFLVCTSSCKLKKTTHISCEQPHSLRQAKIFTSTLSTCESYFSELLVQVMLFFNCSRMFQLSIPNKALHHSLSSFTSYPYSYLHKNFRVFPSWNVCPAHQDSKNLLELILSKQQHTEIMTSGHQVGQVIWICHKK